MLFRCVGLIDGAFTASLLGLFHEGVQWLQWPITCSRRSMWPDALSQSAFLSAVVNTGAAYAYLHRSPKPMRGCVEFDETVHLRDVSGSTGFYTSFWSAKQKSIRAMSSREGIRVARGATSSFSCLFSYSITLSRLASSAFIPPYCFRQRSYVDWLISRACNTADSSLPEFNIAEELVARGLSPFRRRLFVIDGSKALQIGRAHV